MNRRSIVLILLCALALTASGCRGMGARAKPRPQIDLKVEGPQKDIVLTYAAEGMKQPLKITAIPGKDKGAIFFETDKGRTWLRGEPAIEKGSDKFQATWTLDGGRRVTFSIAPDGKNSTVRLKAAPDNDILKWGFNLDAAADEYFTGCFERTVDGDQKLSWAPGLKTAMDLRGQTISMLLKPTLSLYSPFYLSSRGYGVFVHGTWPGQYDFCKEVPDRVQIEFEGSTLEFSLYASDQPAEIVKAHAQEAGPTILPPLWAFRPWRWRDNHTHKPTYYDGTPVTAPYNSMIVEDILMMEAYGIPCGVYWVDRPWATGPDGYDDFEWDTQRLPNPQAMIKWLESKDVKFLLWIGPWVMGHMADEALTKGYNLQGQKRDLQGPKRHILLDFANPEAVKWWQEKGLAKVLRDGVRGFKLDRAEEIMPESREFKVFDGRTTRETRNDYPVEYVRATHEITQRFWGDDFILIPRAGYTHSSRYSGFWGGDINSPAEGLRTAIIALQRSAVNGYPIWGSDTGGYWGGDVNHEVMARWLGFSCFCPIMEVGPTDDRGLWEMKQPPSYDTELIAIWRLYARIHNDLAPYTYDCAKEARRTGMPIARPLFLVYPGQAEAWKDWQTYLYGPDILVSAIWEKGVEKHRLYLPAGERWIDAWDSGTVLDGGQTIEVAAPKHKMPIFIRQGSSVKLGDLKALYDESLKIAAQKPNLKELQKAVALPGATHR